MSFWPKHERIMKRMDLLNRWWNTIATGDLLADLILNKGTKFEVRVIGIGNSKGFVIPVEAQGWLDQFEIGDVHILELEESPKYGRHYDIGPKKKA